MVSEMAMLIEAVGILDEFLPPDFGANPSKRGETKNIVLPKSFCELILF